jgi:hypothetical protein
MSAEREASPLKYYKIMKGIRFTVSKNVYLCQFKILDSTI